MQPFLLYRYILCLFLGVAFLCQTFSRSFIVAEYHINQAKYAALCENRDKPEMECNGHCQMMKKLSIEKEQKKEDPPSFRNTLFEPLFLSSFAQPNCAIFLDARLCHNSAFQSLNPSRFSSDFFHPPEV